MSCALDAFLPDYAHGSVYERDIAASPGRVWETLHEVTAGELTITRPLVFLRGLPARVRGRRYRFAVEREVPLLERFMRGGWFVLREEAPKVFLAGAVGQPWRVTGGDPVSLDGAGQFAGFARAGYVRMGLSFELAATGAGTLLRTETRVAPTDQASARAFGRYWFAIRAGSGLIRRDLLRAIAGRAEDSRAPIRTRV